MESTAPQRYRKKPVVIEAIRYDGTEQSAIAINHWTGGKAQETSHFSDGYRLVVDTEEGTMEARPGDWIIKGVAGEFYPCKPDIFAQTYEATEDQWTPVEIADARLRVEGSTLKIEPADGPEAVS